MITNGDEWTLTHRDRVCGVITVEDSDQPWVYGAWTPTADFSAVASLFEHELAVLEALTQANIWDAKGVAELEAAEEAIRHAVELHYPDGRTVPEFLLHIDGVKAWFRWNDEPFD